FYYPSSAGKGIDIYLMDGGLITNHEDFNTSERTITCDAISKEEDEFPDHGIMVTSMAGGNIYGVSKKANLHMIAIDFSDDSVLRALDFIKARAKPNKTIISMSFAGNYYSQAEDEKHKELINEGIILIVCASNENMNCCAPKDDPDFISPVGYRRAIVVGATDTDVYGNGYYRASYSNYGDCVDVFAPGTVIFPDLSEGSRKNSDDASGTSCSTPIVAGIAA
ncbi:subtilisin-like protein, partial [Anaeromyces robustus]